MNGANLLLILLLVAVLGWAVARVIRRYRQGSACCGERQATVKRTGPKDSVRAHYPYAATAEISGMTCDNCAARVENALNGLEGVWARVRIDTRRAQLRCKTPPDERAVRECVAQAGYSVAWFQGKQ